VKVYTYSEARQHFALLLEEARKEGAVRIRRREGQTFVLLQDKSSGSPLNVAGPASI
jgi:PHD/YefM family antitoxin component YafN of YafNO toxin-antitoxin module